MFGQLDAAKTEEDFAAAAALLKTLPVASGKLGVVGFCWGGGMANTLATRVPELDAAVPFYGDAPALDKVPRIRARLLLVFADNDARVNASWPPYEAALRTAAVPFEAAKYSGTQHGFNNDTTPRYDERAARLAWQRTLAYLNRPLRG